MRKVLKSQGILAVLARMKEKPHSIQLYKIEFSFFLKLQRLRFGKPLQTRNLQGLLLFLREKWIFLRRGERKYGLWDRTKIILKL